ncbi:MAG: ribbon-helix-helix protein, CopG family [Steroidobacteraceae bacterium]|nr:ribbon-helix-helix protein, CopG family [Deltaproteobacteria bacterium]
MSNIKDNPRYNVISLRVSDQEKAVINEVSRLTRKSVSQVMLEAIRSYSRDVSLFSAESRYPA